MRRTGFRRKATSPLRRGTKGLRRTPFRLKLGPGKARRGAAQVADVEVDGHGKAWARPGKSWRRKGPSAEDRAWERAEREAVKERDGHRCRCPGCPNCDRTEWRETTSYFALVPDGTLAQEVCQRGEPRFVMQVDHVEGLGRRVPGGRWNLEHPLNARENKRTTCEPCHDWKTTKSKRRS